MVENEPQIESGAWEQVLFLGSKELFLKEFRVKIPVSKNYSVIYYKDPTVWKGPIPLTGKEDYTNPIENSRIRDNITIFVGGKKTLPVLADLKAGNINRSFLDTLVYSYQVSIKEYKTKISELKAKIERFEKFLKRMHLERTYMAYIMSIAEKGRKLGLRVTKPPEAVTPVAVTVGSTEERKRRR